VDLPTGASEQLEFAERDRKARPAGRFDRRELLPVLLWKQTAFVPVGLRGAQR
jgi:hypothetical protein